MVAEPLAVAITNSLPWASTLSRRASDWIERRTASRVAVDPGDDDVGADRPLQLGRACPRPRCGRR